MIAHATALSAAPAPTSSSSGATLVATDGRVLPLRSTSVVARAGGGLCRVELAQTFVNDHAEPLHVVYQVPLPADGAVSGYRFVIGERVVVGKIDRRAEARRAFEEAIVSGRTAALLEQDRSSVFRQELGNVPAGATVRIEIAVDQPLVWSGELGGAWEWRFPTVVAPRYLGEAGRVADAARVTVPVTLDPMTVGTTMQLTIVDTARSVECPSHAIQTRTGMTTAVALAEGSAPLDRDLVVRWQVAGRAASSSVELGRTDGDDAHALVTIVPPHTDQLRGAPHVARDLIVLLDTSGSMSGAPLAQAQRIASALVDQLDSADSLELIEFSTQPRRWQPSPVAAEPAARAAAKQWIAGLVASGGTEMHRGIQAALSTLRPEAQRQVVLVTDGHIGFEAEIVGELHRSLPRGCRVHTIGVGSAVNRSLTSPAARAGRGVEIVIGIDEDPERAVAKLLAHTGAPQIVDLELDGDALLEHAPIHLPDLMAGTPAIISARVRSAGGTLRIRGRSATGTWEQRLTLSACGPSEGNPAIVARFGRQKVEDLELAIAAGERGLDGAIEAVGLAYRIATRLTSWVAISAEAMVDPTEPTRREVMPHALPHGMSASGVGLRPAGGGALFAAAPAMPGAAPAQGGADGFGAGGPVARRARASAPPAASRPAPPAPARAAAPPPRKLEEQRFEAEAAPAEADEAAAADDLDERKADAAPKKRAMETITGRGGRPLVIHGKFTRMPDGTVIIELALPEGPFAWSSPQGIDLVIDGTTHGATIDATRTTRSGTVAQGVLVRVCCTGVPAGAVSEARFSVGAAYFVVQA